MEGLPINIMECKGLREEDEGENNTNCLPKSCDCDCQESSKLSDEAENNLKNSLVFQEKIGKLLLNLNPKVSSEGKYKSVSIRLFWIV